MGKHRPLGSRICSKCGGKRDLPLKRYCRECHNAYMREWRKTHPLEGESKKKDLIRHKTKMRVRRGKLLKIPCEICGDPCVEAHHEDYDRPYDIHWLCFKHHRELHKKIKKQ